MKKIAFYVMLVFLAVALSSCAFFRNGEELRNGKWHGIASSDEAIKIEQARMALNKLDASIPQIGYTAPGGSGDSTRTTAKAVPLGYRGLVVNEDRHEKCEIKLIGPERTSFRLNPGEKEELYLTSGKYYYEIRERDGILRHKGSFNVGLEKSHYNGSEYHWYVGNPE
jgi:hypothetical protein